MQGCRLEAALTWRPVWVPHASGFPSCATPLHGKAPASFMNVTLYCKPARPVAVEGRPDALTTPTLSTLDSGGARGRCLASLLRNLHMSRHDALMGSLPLLVLKILGQRGPMHGYALTTAYRDDVGGRPPRDGGIAYPALHRMEEAGWIRARWAMTDASAVSAFMRSPRRAAASSRRKRHVGSR